MIKIQRCKWTWFRCRRD